MTYLSYFEAIECGMQRSQSHAWHIASAPGFVCCVDEDEQRVLIPYPRSSAVTSRLIIMTVFTYIAF